MNAIRFAFVVFVLACIAGAARTPESEAGMRASDYAAQAWQVEMCSAFDRALSIDRGTYTIDATESEACTTSVDEATTLDVARTADAVWSRSETATASECPYRLGDASGAASKDD